MNRLAFLALVYAGSTALLKGFGFLLSLWLAKTLAVTEYASWGLAVALQTGLMSFGIVGIIESVVSLLPHRKAEEDRTELFSAANGVFLMTVGISMLGAALIMGVIETKGALDVILLISLLISGGLLAFSTLQAQLLRLEERHSLSLGYSFVAPLCGSIGSAVSFALTRTTQAFFIGSAAGMILGIGALRMAGMGVRRTRTTGSSQKMIWIRVLPFVAVALFGWLSGYGSNFVVNSLFQPSEVARCTFALTIGSVLQLVATALNQTWSPRFYAMSQTEDFTVVERKNLKFFTLQSVVLGVVGGLCIALLPPLLRLFGGNLAYYGTMGRELFFVAAGYVCLSPWWHCQNYFLLHDKGMQIMNIVLVTSGIGIAVWLALMWKLGPIGVYVGFFVQMILRMAGGVVAARRMWPLKIAWVGMVAGICLLAIGVFFSHSLKV